MKKNKIKWRNPRIDTVDQTECNTKNAIQRILNKPADATNWPQGDILAKLLFI